MTKPDDDHRDPAFITDVFKRIGRHFHVAERTIAAGNKHSWLPMARDVFDAICLLNRQVGDMIGVVQQLARQGSKTTAGAQGGLEAVNARLDRMEKRLETMSRLVTEVMSKQEDIDAKLGN